MDTAKITSKGQITIPKRVRVRLAVVPGDQLAFEFDEAGALRVTPVRKPLPSLLGFLAKDAAGRRLGCEQIDDAIQQRMCRKYGLPSCTADLWQVTTPTRVTMRRQWRRGLSLSGTRKAGEGPAALDERRSALAESVVD